MFTSRPAQLKPKFELGKDNLTKEFKAKSPTGYAPILETPQGVLFESNAIARYIARIRRDTELLGRTFFESGEVDAWMDYSSHDVELPAIMWLYPIIGWSPYNESVHKKVRSACRSKMAACMLRGSWKHTCRARKLDGC